MILFSEKFLTELHSQFLLSLSLSNQSINNWSIFVFCFFDFICTVLYCISVRKRRNCRPSMARSYRPLRVCTVIKFVIFVYISVLCILNSGHYGSLHCTLQVVYSLFLFTLDFFNFFKIKFNFVFKLMIFYLFNLSIIFVREDGLFVECRRILYSFFDF